MPEQFEIDLYRSAKQKISEAEKGIENCRLRIKDYEQFMRNYQDQLKDESNLVRLFLSLYPEYENQ